MSNDGFSAEWRTANGTFFFNFEPDSRGMRRRREKNDDRQTSLFDPPEDELADLVGRYLRQCTDKSPDAHEQAKDLYRSFAYFCHEEVGISIKQMPSLKAIAKPLQAQPHIERVKGRTVCYHGIRIRPEWIAPAGWRTGSRMFDGR